MNDIANIYNEAGGEPPDEPYIKKAGDTATGLIVFNGGIEVNFGTAVIDCPAEFSDTVTFKPTADIIIQCPVTLQGPSLIIGCTDTEFTGDTVEFNNNTTTFNGPQQINIAGGGTTDLNITAQTNFDGWPITVQNATIDLSLNANIQYPDTTDQISAYTGAGALAGAYNYTSITLDTNGRITTISSNSAPVNLLPLNNTWTGTNDFTAGITTTTTTYGDSTVQDSAFTGAAVLAGAYTYTSMTIDADGAITALSSGAPPVPPVNLLPLNNTWTGTNNFTQPTTATSLLLNSLTVDPTAGGSQPSFGISNSWNTGGSVSFTGTGGRNVGGLNGYFCAGTSVKVDSKTSTIPPAIASLFEINFTFFNGSNWGQTYCYLQVYPNKFFNSAAISPYAYWNINNKINGDATYTYTSPTYAPSGRMYWTYQQNFSGISTLVGANAWILPRQNYFEITFQIPDNSYSYECNVSCLDATSMTSQNRSWLITDFAT